MNSTRPYSMAVRSRRAEATRERILDAARSLFAVAAPPFTLDRVAELAGTSVQTVLRTFGSKDGLIVAAIGSLRSPVAPDPELPGDVGRSVASLVDDYEIIGPRVLFMLANEDRIPDLHAAAEVGRDDHRAWVEHAFGPQLATLRGTPRRRSALALVAATDIYVWKLVRVDLGRGRSEAEATIRQLVEGVLRRMSEEG